MKWWFFGLAITFVPLCAAQEALLPTPVRVYTSFQNTPSAALALAMRAEVESIMAPSGLSFQWSDLAAADGREMSAQLAIIRFLGKCDLNGLTPRPAVPGPLGWTHLSDGVIIPFADVDCSAVRSFIQREMFTMRAADRVRSYGRALGRVLAHELYHIFANTTHHSSDGVARPTYTVRDLLAESFHLEEGDAMVLANSARSASGFASASSEDAHRY